MNLGDVGIVAAICSPLVVGAGTAGKYWAENEFITVGSFEQAFNKKEMRDLKSDIRELEYLKQKGLATERQLWKLEDLKQELESIQ